MRIFVSLVKLTVIFSIILKRSSSKTTIINKGLDSILEIKVSCEANETSFRFYRRR
ncbi:hypothetical protein LEP1GSC198_2765 [Leptospira kirschneri str. JB]|nr:hypothetical protein LEP1GSC198_2765 [Leptospira kirschneri str. JB]